MMILRLDEFTTLFLFFFSIVGISSANNCQWCQEYSGQCADSVSKFQSGATAKSAFSTAIYGSFCGNGQRDTCASPCNNVDQLCMVRLGCRRRHCCCLCRERFPRRRVPSHYCIPSLVPFSHRLFLCSLSLSLGSSNMSRKRRC